MNEFDIYHFNAVSTFVNDNDCNNTKKIYFWVSFQLCLAANIMLFFLLIWNYIFRNHFQVNLFVKLASSKASVLSNNVSISKKNFFSLTFLSSFFSGWTSKPYLNAPCNNFRLYVKSPSWIVIIQRKKNLFLTWTKKFKFHLLLNLKEKYNCEIELK